MLQFKKILYSLVGVSLLSVVFFVPALAFGDNQGSDCVLVSNIETKVGDHNDQAVLAAGHSGWTASIPGASWIWSTYRVVDPLTQSTVIFKKDFPASSVPTNAILDIAVDNIYVAKINGVVVASSTASENFASATSHIITGSIISGNNQLTIEATNLTFPDATSETNPAGVLFRLHIEGAICDNPVPVNHSPSISLTGSNLITLTLGQTFTDPGATATDTEDGDLTAHIVVVGSVSTTTVSTSTLVYSVTDSKGLIASTSRTVIVQATTTLFFNKAPFITPLQGSPLIFAFPQTFTDPGATAIDDHDGDISSNLIVTLSAATTSRSIFPDVSTNHVYFPYIATVAIQKVMAGYTNGNFDPEGYLTREQSAATIVNRFNISIDNLPTVSSFSDVPMSNPYWKYIEAIYRANIAVGCSTSPLKFCPGEIITRSEYAIFVVRGANFDLATATPQPYFGDVSTTTDFIFPYIQVLYQNGITAGCSVTSLQFCPNAGVIRGEAAVWLARLGPRTNIGTIDTHIPGTYILTYTVVDSHGVRSITERAVIVNPCVSNCGGGQVNHFPVITLLGGNPLTITVGQTFTDPGATATDTEDGDLTSHIVITGSVSTTTVSTSTLVYSVTDSKGLIASTSRTVIVLNATTTKPACSDVLDNDNDGKVDATDPGCHSDNDPNNTSSYDLNDNDEADNPPSNPTSNPPKKDDNRSSGSSGGRRHPVVVGEVLGATSCSYLKDFLKITWKNDPIEVLKMQSFLNIFEKEILSLSGVFNQSTFEAVERFQNKYFDDILEPWGHTAPTGFVYILTKKKVNEIYCSTILTLTPAEQQEILAFRAFLKSLQITGGLGSNADYSAGLRSAGSGLTDVSENVLNNIEISANPRVVELTDGTTSISSTSESVIRNVAVSLFALPQKIFSGNKYFLLLFLILIAILVLVIKWLFSSDSNSKPISQLEMKDVDKEISKVTEIKTDLINTEEKTPVINLPPSGSIYGETPDTPPNEIIIESEEEDL